MSQCAVNVENLSFAYTPGKAVLNIKSWRLKTAESVFLFGPSGCGKSTFLNLLSGLLPVSSGQIHINDTNLSALAPSKRDAFRAKSIGVVLQQFNLVPYLSVLDNIRLASYFSSGSKDGKVEQRAGELLHELNLPNDVLFSQASELSVGQQQRVAIARALINQPAVIIADEPSSALDADATDAFMQLLKSAVKKTSASLIFVSHDQSLSKHFDRVESLMDINHLGRES
ncbi:ABC transporter ATP-binding protein [Glaciecola sp. MH2013]|uniref:ABC transporter ATP-binding protein n=1 Tax=Glaciecola sp. MH2013 TaxID=2785524 RepID=UPI00189F8C56|nr:ABC transporter ATP-binding protein [Glaciecola sp. MH2013]MBF7073745.1 ABC transporter ATP-binding protein [Glaciecola sp. MH2013]